MNKKYEIDEDYIELNTVRIAEKHGRFQRKVNWQGIKTPRIGCSRTTRMTGTSGSSSRLRERNPVGRRFSNTTA